jgi:uncharacterized protein YndB with AHSA1/START domain
MKTTEAIPTRKATITTPTDREIRTERIFNASREWVWQAMTQPELLKQWWGRGNKLVIERLEVVPGGHWRFVEHADGETHGFEGRFSEVTPPMRLVQTFEWDGMPGHVMLSTATLEELDPTHTRLVSVALFHTAADRDGMLQLGMEGGMNESYNALDRVLATLK